MAVVYAASLKTTRMQAVQAAIDAGAAGGVIEIGTAGMATVLASIGLADPCGVVAGSVLTFTMPRSDTSADNTGTAVEARIKDSNGNIVVSGLTVGTSGADVIMNSTAISAAQTVTINSATITHG